MQHRLAAKHQLSEQCWNYLSGNVDGQQTPGLASTPAFSFFLLFALIIDYSV